MGLVVLYPVLQQRGSEALGMVRKDRVTTVMLRNTNEEQCVFFSVSIKSCCIWFDSINEDTKDVSVCKSSAQNNFGRLFV